MARLLGEQGEDDQSEVAVTEHAPGTEWSTGTAAETRTKRAWAIMGRAAEAAPAGAVGTRDSSSDDAFLFSLRYILRCI